jgi:hypothetical protein
LPEIEYFQYLTSIQFDMMTDTKRMRIAYFFRLIGRYGLLLLLLPTILFSLVSGAEGFGGGWLGVLKNSLNAIPWIALCFILWIAWKSEFVGGLLITLFGLILVWFMNVRVAHFYWFTFVLTSIIPLLGICFLVSHYLRRSAKSNQHD